MAKILGVEHTISTLDGETEATILVDTAYPVAFELSGEPEPWEETVRRHQAERPQAEGFDPGWVADYLGKISSEVSRG
jgi:hypothetical protein